MDYLIPNHQIARENLFFDIPLFTVKVNFHNSVEENWIPTWRIDPWVAFMDRDSSLKVLKTIEKVSRIKSHLFHPISVVALGSLVLIPVAFTTNVALIALCLIVNAVCIGLLVQEVKKKALTNISAAFLEENTQANNYIAIFEDDPEASLRL